jgi:cobalt-zinc-cadmium efflux system outer membrane protein
MKHSLSKIAALCLLCCIAHTLPLSAFQTGANNNALASGRSEPLTLSRALSLVAESNPELNVSELEIRAVSARILQAGLRPNPEFSAGAENFLAMGGTGIFRYTESTFQVSQRLELGGKRAVRVRAREKELALAGEMLELKKVELIAAASLAFAEVLAGQERLANQRELAQLARQAHAIVVERVAAGKVSPVEQTRATVALSSAQLEEEKQLKELLAAKDWLAALWGGSQEDFDTVQAVFEIPSALPFAAKSCIESSPEMKLAAAAVDLRRSLVDVERAARRPDLTVSAGFKRLNLEDLNSWVAGASIPLPIFDRRQGAIAEARIRMDKATSEKKVVEWRLRAGLVQARHDHEIALLEAKALTQTALPASKEALAATEEGYRFGKFDFLNVLDAQRTYAELHRRYIEAVASGLKAAIEIDRLARCDSSAHPARPAGEMKEASHEE